MRTIKTYISALMILLAAASCEKEGDLIYLSGQESSELSSTQSDVILSLETRENQVLSMSWSTTQLSVSDESMGTSSSLPSITIEVSGSSDFTSAVELSPSGNSHSFSGARLNTIAKDAGLVPDESSPLYFRIKSLLGQNMEPVFSNTVVVNVTPYVIDMSKLFILNTDQDDTLSVIYSPESDGEYSGFMPATGWMNFYFLEGDGTIWGNNGVSEVPFELSSDAETMWNCWFPANGGYYWVTMSTNDKEWSATWLPKISVSGAVDDSLAFYKTQELWAGVIETSSANAQILLSSEALLYNTGTGDSDASAITTTINFAEGEGGTIVLSDAAGDITVPNAGVNTVTLDLRGENNWTYSITEGENLPQEEESIPYLYLPGTKDGETGGSWTFDNYLTQGTDGLYTGVVYINSLWGFQMFTEPAWGVDYYTMGETEGILVKNGEGNIPAPEIGTYLIKADTDNLTYSLKALGDVVYVSGLNDVWDFSTTLSKVDNGVYSGTIEVTQTSEWGFAIYIESENWDDFFGGSEGNLSFGGSNITDDTVPGTYSLTVDLINGSYEMTLSE